MNRTIKTVGLCGFILYRVRKQPAGPDDYIGFFLLMGLIRAKCKGVEK
jgi:hypothetical protein